ncbi:type VI secretion system baseplate subunit TssF [Flavobacterium branchiarum]|uniref:Type VI secretion system baseplate subunit TssF n=1 Tax=Flavobacterium branchiarum TaxID=1114870 RepID=A0ABV5FPC5_9FLAO|nr:type VI secretion system baseplate subunit TssF [Flavobacterium branchiarum]MDN3672798.1 type VI secretion system baseplate subunit TssF [Flavobacterium branchiarum]
MRQERIKDRVLKRAARSWGFSDVEMETSFDPVVSMMLNALSYELEKVADELENSKTRVVERVLEIMFPEVTAGTKPSRAIMHALPLENNMKVSLHNQMVVGRRIHNIYNPLAPITKEIVLSPTIEIKLSSAEVRYIAYERNLYEVSNIFYKDSVRDYRHSLPSGEVFLGVELKNTNVLELEDLMLYIDIKNTHQKEMFHYYLKQMKCFHDNLQVTVEEGYNVPINHLDIESIINRNYTHLSEVMQEVNEYYFDNFYTFKGPLKHKEMKEYDVEYKYFEDVTNKNNNPVIWIKLIFPESLIPQILDNVSFTANCFPVINKKKHTINKALGDYLSYVALETDDNIYLDVDTVVDGYNNHYEIKEFKDGVIEEGNAVLRTGGVSRFDSRSASELLQNVLDLLKDESSSFAGLGKDFMNSSLVEINQLLASVEQQAKESSFSKNNAPYLMIKPKIDESVGKSFSINYWSTCAEEGNDIKAGTVLESKDDFSFVSKESVLVTNTVGGLNKQNNKDRILAYRNALLTRGRIVTFADIKAFSLNHFKSCITGVKIEKGTRKEISVKAGFSRTVDIHLIVNLIEKEYLSATEWDYLCDSFMKNLKNRSSNVFPYRLFIENESINERKI